MIPGCIAAAETHGRSGSTICSYLFKEEELSFQKEEEEELFLTSYSHENFKNNHNIL